MTSEAITEWAAVSTAVFTGTGILAAGLWRVYAALISKFDELEEKRTEQFNGMKQHVDGTFDKHESLDQRRHEDNLVEFRRIYVALAQVGWRNGGNGQHPA